MAQEHERQRVVELSEAAEKAHAQGEKEWHAHGFIWLQTQEWVDRAEQARDEYEEQIPPDDDEICERERMPPEE